MQASSSSMLPVAVLLPVHPEHAAEDEGWEGHEGGWEGDLGDLESLHSEHADEVLLSEQDLQPPTSSIYGALSLRAVAAAVRKSVLTEEGDLESDEDLQPPAQSPRDSLPSAPSSIKVERTSSKILAIQAGRATGKVPAGFPNGPLALGWFLDVKRYCCNVATGGGGHGVRKCGKRAAGPRTGPN